MRGGTQEARRSFVLLNAHLFRDPWVHLGESDTLIFDFHAFPSRPMPHSDQPENCTLNASFEVCLASSWRKLIERAGRLVERNIILDLAGFDIPKVGRRSIGWRLAYKIIAVHRRA